MKIAMLLALLTGCASEPFDANVDCPLLRIEYEIQFHELFSSDDSSAESKQEYDQLLSDLEQC